MRHLTLIRHAKSSWKQAELADIDRPLNKRGLASAPVMGRVLKERAVQFDKVFTSSARRARITIELICEEIGIAPASIVVSDDLYTFSYRDILKWLKRVNDNYHDIALGGHNPACHNLFSVLTNKSLDKYPTCAVARFQFDLGSWSEITAGTGKLVFFDIPRNHLTG